MGATEEGTGENRTDIIQGFRKAESLYAQAFELLGKDRDRAQILKNYAVTFYNRTLEAADKNRPNIIQGYEKAIDFGVRILEARERNMRAQVFLLNIQLMTCCEQTKEASKKNRDTVIEGCKKVKALANESLEALSGMDLNQSSSLILQVGVSFDQVGEAATRNRSNIIQGYEKSKTLGAQSIAAYARGDLLRGSILHQQGVSCCDQIREAARNNRPDVIKEYDKADQLLNQALELEQRDPTQSVELLKKSSNQIEKARKLQSDQEPSLLQQWTQGFLG